MSQLTKPEAIPAGSSTQGDVLADEMTTRVTESTLEQAGTPWQFLQQGYAWTGGSLRTKGYRTDFDAVHDGETAIRMRPPAPAPLRQVAAGLAGRMDWRHPDHLGMVAEFVSSLNAPAPAAGVPALQTAKPVEPLRRAFWQLLVLSAAAVCVLGPLLFSQGQRGDSQTRVQPVPMAATLPLPPPAEPLLNTAAPPVLTEIPEAPLAPTEVTPIEAAAVVGPASERSPPATAPRSRIELEAREVLVSGRAVAAVVILKRTGSTLDPVRVRWKTVPGTATPGEDYEGVSGIVKFADGQAVRTLFVPILQPQARTEPRTFSIALQRLRSGPALGPVASTTVTIWEDS